MQATDPRLSSTHIRQRYSDPDGYGEVDAWHQFTAAEIDREIARFWERLPRRAAKWIILNAGSGSTDLGLSSSDTINLDIAEARLSKLTNAIVGNVISLPLADQSVDFVVCVGSVINYCDPAAAISEFYRVLRPNGHLALEFDTSMSAELLSQPAFGRSVGVAETFYAERDEIVWVYSPAHISKLLRAAGFWETRSIPIHVLSPWALLFNRERVAANATMARFDRVARRLPLICRWASNRLEFCVKRTS